MKSISKLVVSAVLAIVSIPAIENASAAPRNVAVSDIRGSTENSADTKLYQRGFTLVDGKDSGGESFKTYYNSKSRQCVMVEIMDNKVVSINPTQSASCGQGSGSAQAAPAKNGNVSVSDLRGSTENGADAKLYKRGFTLVDGKDSGGESFKTYYNSKSRQCVMVEIMDNKVISINPSQSASCR